MILRNYQQTAVDQIREAYRTGKRAPLLVSPTGSGKTCIFSFIAQGSQAKGNRTLILAHRQEIIRQIEDALTDFDTPHGVIAAGRDSYSSALTQVASVQTLSLRIEKISPPDLIVIDEAHHSVCETYRRIISAFPQAKILGVTATPIRLDGSGLGGIFDSLILGPPVSELIAQGFLSCPFYYAPPSDIDTSQLHILGGDFRHDESEAMMDRPTITGSAIDHYKRLCDNSRALVFCTSLKHAANVAQQFRDAGYPTAMIDGTMGDQERLRIITLFRNGELLILVSVDLVGEGFDCPGAEVGIMLRPTASLALWLQQIGRILRPAPGKNKSLVLDHTGNCLRHGLAEEPRTWTLDAKKRRHTDKFKTNHRQCPACYAVHMIMPACPQCGHVYPIKSREIDQQEGELQELTAEQIEESKKRRRMQVGMAKDFKALLAIEKERGYKTGWAYMQWRRRNRRKTPTPGPALEPAQWAPKSQMELI